MKTILFNLRLFCALTFCNDANLRSTNKQDHGIIGNRSRSFGTQLLMLAGQSLGSEGSESCRKEVTHQSD